MLRGRLPNNNFLMAPEATGQRRYATDPEWDDRKDEIIRLYWNEDRTLAEVMKLLQETHGFNATYVQIKTHQQGGYH